MLCKYKYNYFELSYKKDKLQETEKMNKRHFSLETAENNRITRIFQVLFGLICLGIAVFWLIYNFSTIKSDSSLWLTIIFLAGFGSYLVRAGLGYAYKFIEISESDIRIKNNSFLPIVKINADEMERIEVFPLKVIILLKSSKKILTRFGVSDPPKVEKIKDEILRFATDNKIKSDLRNENL
jgi:hypothetical protein